MNDLFQNHPSILIDEERLIPFAEIPKKLIILMNISVYLQKQGNLYAVKIENILHSSKRTLKEYQKSIKK